MMIAYLGLAAFGLLLWHNQNATTRVIAERQADISANAAAQYTQCVKSIPQLRRINRFLHGVQIEHETLLQNSILAHKAQPRGTRLWHTQVGNIRRLRIANEAVQGITFPIPSLHRCKRLRARLLAHTN